MSLSLPPLSLPSSYRRKSLSASDGPPSPRVSLHASYYSGSPPLSSSPPPHTPLSVYSRSSARIHSSPLSPFDTGFRIPDIDESLAFDSRSRYSPPKAPQLSITLPSFSASFPSDDELTFALDYDASESSDECSPDDMHVSFQYRTNRKRISYRMRTKRQRDEMEDPETDILSDDSRGTFFSISAERGQWMNDPMPFWPRLDLPPVTPPVFQTESGDPKTDIIQTANAYSQDQPSAESIYPSPPVSVTPDAAISEESQSVWADELRPRSKTPPPHSTLSSPRAVRHTFISSPKSALDATSPITAAQLHSPMSLPPSSPITFSLSSAAVSPLSLTLDLPDNPDEVLTAIDQIAINDVTLEDMDLESIDGSLPTVKNDSLTHLACVDQEVGIQTTSESDCMLTAIASAPEEQLQPDRAKSPVDHLESAYSITSLLTPCISEAENGLMKSEPLCAGVIPSVESPTYAISESNTHSQEMAPTVEMSVEETSQRLASPSLSTEDQASTQLTIPVPTSEAIVKTEVGWNLETPISTTESSPEADIEKRKSVKRRMKRPELEFSSSENDSEASCKASSSTQADRIQSPKQGRDGRKPLRKRSRVLRVVEDDEDEDEEQVRMVSCPKRSFIEKPLPASKTEPAAKEKSNKRRARRRKEDIKGDDKENKVRRRISTASSQARATSTISDNDVDPTPRPTTPAETTTFWAEMRGMLIESMATSRASSLPLSALCRSILQCRPALASQRSEKEWLKEFEGVLEEGWKGSGVFGKVESSWKDDSGSSLEAQWFYVPERDEDQERATLIRSMMPRPGKRSETKKYKQYYYRPLEKISRWDPEDEM